MIWMRWIGLLLLAWAGVNPANVAQGANCPEGPSPQSIARPEALGPVPVQASAWPETVAKPAAEALMSAALNFAGRSPAWSLAVAGPQLGFWEHSVGAQLTDRFAAASIGKSMTAVLIFQLVERDQLRLDQTIESWFPDLPRSNEVTIEHLLTHRSGYVVPATGPLMGPYRPPEDTFARLIELGLAHCPGQGWAYSNVAYQLLGRIIEQVSGLPYAMVLDTQILEPLALEHTQVLTPGIPDEAMVGGHQAGEPVGEVDYASAYAAAPVSTTAGDLLRYWRALLSGQLISASSLNQMVDPAWPMFGDERMRYGAGIQVADIPAGPGAMLMHSGGITGFSATVAWLPEYELWVAVMANERQVPAEAALWALVRALAELDQ